LEIYSKGKYNEIMNLRMKSIFRICGRKKWEKIIQGWFIFNFLINVA